MNEAFSRGDVAEVEGRLAVYMLGKNRTANGRWEWMDGTWTTIPLSVGDVLFNAYDLAAHRAVAADAARAELVARVRELHTPNDLGDGSPEGVIFCNEDAHSYPCPTLRALVAPDHAEAL